MKFCCYQRTLATRVAEQLHERAKIYKKEKAGQCLVNLDLKTIFTWSLIPPVQPDFFLGLSFYFHLTYGEINPLQMCCTSCYIQYIQFEREKVSGSMSPCVFWFYSTEPWELWAVRCFGLDEGAMEIQSCSHFTDRNQRASSKAKVRKQGSGSYGRTRDYSWFI